MAPTFRGPAHRRAALALVAAFSLPLWGCASDYVARTSSVRSAYQAYDYDGALQSLDTEEKKAVEKDRLLVLLDKGMVLHADGRYEDSAKVLAEAEKLSEQLDVVSVSEEATTLATNERERAYRGEDFEKLMINVLQAINFARLGRDDDALVEVRRVDLRLKTMVVDEKKPYEQLVIARYLGGVLREDQKDWDSAFIDYYKAWQLQPSLGPLASPMLRLAKKLDRSEYEELKAALKDVDDSPLGPDEGELVVVVEAGLSPEKKSTAREGEGQVMAIPAYRDRWTRLPTQVKVEGASVAPVTVTDLAGVARVHLNDRIGRMIAKNLASTAVKAGLAAGAGALTKNKDVGFLTFALLMLTQQPDLRSWLSLPAEFQLARMRLPKGEHLVTIESAGKTTEQKVDVRPGRISLVVVRRY